MTTVLIVTAVLGAVAMFLLAFDQTEREIRHPMEESPDWW